MDRALRSEPRYTCNVSEPTEGPNIPGNAPTDGFVLEIVLNDRYENFYNSRARNRWVLHSVTAGLNPTKASFYVPRARILSTENADWEDIAVMLQLLEIPSPEHRVMVPKIKEFAINLAGEPANASPTVLAVLVEIGKWTTVNITDHIIQGVDEDDDAYENEEELLAEVARMSMNSEDPPGGNNKPTAARSIEELLKNGSFTVTAPAKGKGKGKKDDDDDDDVEKCAICLEQLSVGSQAIRMPCKHKFHADCILEWLMNRNVCPLCRFEMPVDDDEP